VYEDGDDPAAPHRYHSVAEMYWAEDAAHDHDEHLLLTPHGEPATVAEAEQDERWRAAMRAELASIEENNTWSLTELASSGFFKLKRDADGNVLKHKARLMVKGYVQRPGIDFDEVFAPVARLDSVRLLLAVAKQRRWEVHHMDVKTSFLNGELEEEVYVAQQASSMLANLARFCACTRHSMGFVKHRARGTSSWTACSSLRGLSAARQSTRCTCASSMVNSSFWACTSTI
jgi:hypothetical protein